MEDSDAANNVCCHGVIGADGTVIQTLPWNRRGWHCASGWNGSGNNTHIGVEMAEPSTIRYTGGASFVDNNPTATKKFVLGTYKTAVELFAYLCKMYNLNPLGDGIIISHNEGYKRGIASVCLLSLKLKTVGAELSPVAGFVLILRIRFNT